MKILNLYANIGGNRRLWGDEHEITAIELNPKVAEIYKEFWPHDTVIVADAHQYLLDHYEEFDFIWASPPCPTHSQVGRLRAFNKHNEATGQYSPAKYPDMKLYQEILLLKHYFKGLWCVENVIAFYEPLIRPTEFGGHWFWTNFALPTINIGSRGMGNNEDIEEKAKKMGFDIEKLKKRGIDVRLCVRDCTEPELGKHILNYAMNPINIQPDLFTV